MELPRLVQDAGPATTLCLDTNLDAGSAVHGHELAVPFGVRRGVEVPDGVASASHDCARRYLVASRLKVRVPSELLDDELWQLVVRLETVEVVPERQKGPDWPRGWG